MNDLFKSIAIVSLIVLIGGCSAVEDKAPLAPTEFEDELDIFNGWLVSPVFGGGPGKDGIPAISNPNLAIASRVDFLDDDDLVIGVEIRGVARAYPHKLLDWHEIVNDELGGEAIAVTYCPLTGTAIGWKRTLNGVKTTFGVSGLLHNSNLIPYDRETDSNWSQILNKSVQGELIGQRAELFNVIETTWKTWRKFYPATEVVTLQQELSGTRNYDIYPYGTYKEINEVFWPINNEDDRLHKKERVLGVIVGDDAKAYTIESFLGNLKIMNDKIGSESVVIIGSSSRNFAVAYISRPMDGTFLIFSETESTEGIMEDNEGTVWNINGRGVSGPRTGELLGRTESFIGYWFAWGAFYPDIILHSSGNSDK